MIEAMQLGFAAGPPVAPTVATSGFDLTTVLASCGASVPLFLWLLKMHRDLVTLVIPRGFRLIRAEMRRQGAESKTRHGEHLELMKKVASALESRRREDFGKASGRVKARMKAPPKAKKLKRAKRNARPGR